MTFWFEEPGYVMSKGTMVENQPLVAILYLIGISFTVLAGSLGNIMVLGAIYVNKHLRTVGNIFLVNLSLADLHVSCIVNTFSIVGATLGEKWFIHYPRLCEFVACLCLVACYCSLLSIGAVSFNRYIHICHYEYYSRIFTARNTIIMAAAIWVASALFEMPNFFGWGGHHFDHRLQFCDFNFKQSISYTLFFALVGIGVPWGLILLSYVRIFLHVARSKRRVNKAPVDGVDSNAASRVARSRQESMKLARTFFALFMAFTVCWTPFAFLTTIDFAGHAPDPVYIFVVLLAHGNSTANVFLYGLTNSHFRSGYVRFLRLDRIFPSLKTDQRALEKTFNSAIGSTVKVTPSSKTTVPTLALEKKENSMESLGNNNKSV